MPENIVIDQGGEFEGYFNALMEQFGINTKTTGAHAAWQHGLAERRGGLLGAIWGKVVREFHVEGKSMSVAAPLAVVSAKNPTIGRRGLTSEQADFGRTLNVNEVTGRGGDEVLMLLLSAKGVAWRSSQIRAVAEMMLLERDATVKVQGAPVRQAPGVECDPCPGSRLFWAPKPFKGRRRQDAERRRGLRL